MCRFFLAVHIKDHWNVVEVVVVEGRTHYCVEMMQGRCFPLTCFVYLYRVTLLVMLY